MESMTEESEPSYTIVNKQLQDVIRFQHTVIARMKAKVRKQWIQQLCKLCALIMVSYKFQTSSL